MKKSTKIIISVILTIITLTTVGAITFYNYVNQLKTIELKGTNEELKVSEETQEKSKKRNIQNILLLGIDKQENASDTIIVLSIDRDKKTTKVVSLLRDMYVNQGEGMANKINYAYHYGGVEGSVSTVNELFNLDITQYIKVTFDSLVKVIDYIGGVDLNISKKEMESINSRLGSTSITKYGNVHLNGEQALAFSRIRKIDSDAERSGRQREVLMAIFKKAKKMDISKLPTMTRDISSTVETNIGFLDLVDIGTLLLSMNFDQLDELRLPLDGTTSHFLNGVYHLNWDEEVNKKAMHDFIFGEE